MNETCLKREKTPKSPGWDFYNGLIFGVSPLRVGTKNTKNQHLEGFFDWTHESFYDNEGIAGSDTIAVKWLAPTSLAAMLALHWKKDTKL